MIPTKVSEQPDSKPRAEEAAVAGKIYNPLNGNELRELLGIKVKRALAEAEIAESAQVHIAKTIDNELSKHASLCSDVVGFPKADVTWRLSLRGGGESGGMDICNVTFAFSIAQFPQEEGRGISGEIAFLITNAALERDCGFGEKFNCDEIPPDAIRIMNDLPVPTPTRIAHTGSKGEALLHDKPKVATGAQKGAVQKQFANKGEQK